MPSNSNSPKNAGKHGGKPGAQPAPTAVGKAIASRSERRHRYIRIVLGVLLLANVIGAGMVLYPPGGSAEGLAAQLTTLQAEVEQGRKKLADTRSHAASVQLGRTEGDTFVKDYFLGTSAVNSTLLDEISAIGDRAGIRPRGEGYEDLPIEGSETLGMRTITANFESSYDELLNFVREVDRSKQFLMIESLNASPQKDDNVLLVTVELLAFTKQQEGFTPPAPADAQAQDSATDATGDDATQDATPDEGKDGDTKGADGKQKSGADDPGADKPSNDDPGRDKPGANDPGNDKPGVKESSGAPAEVARIRGRQVPR